MCGIVGWLSREGRVEAGVLDAMREELAHRGPDGAGSWVSGDRRVGLGHRRLSIIDLSEEAAQPMHAGHLGNHMSIVFNGEIYNHAELRAKLERRGVRFRSDHSDTEVLLRGIIEWGVEATLEQLVGMFAFAVWDYAHERATLVRDRIGVKPLYVADVHGDLLFASEAKALFQHPRLDPELDHTSFSHFLSFRAVPAPYTMFRGVECLGAGELLEVDLRSGQRSRRTWWDPLARARSAPASLEEAQEELAGLLASSIEHRLEADVPLGLFLSGGVDSAYVLQRMAGSGRPLSTYTVSYPGHRQYDESQEAAERAAAAGSMHHQVLVTASRFGEALARVAYHQDEPIAAPVCASVYFLAEVAKLSGVPVVLAGEGADELFIGYRSWLQLRDAERWNRMLPDVPGRLLRRGAAWLGSRVLPRHSEILRRAAQGQPLFWSGGMDFGEHAKRRILGPEIHAAGPETYEAVIEPLRRSFLQNGDPSDTTGWMTYVDLRFRLPQLMLPRLDKMCMAFSTEGRVPFLDHRVVEYVCGLPPEWRGAIGRETKPLFKAVAERELPGEFVRRPKRGFQAPVKEWRDGTFGHRYLPALEEFARRTGLLNAKALRRLLARRGDRLYFSLTNFMLWYLIYIDDVLDERLPEVSRTRGREVLAA